MHFEGGGPSVVVFSLESFTKGLGFIDPSQLRETRRFGVQDLGFIRILLQQRIENGQRLDVPPLGGQLPRVIIQRHTLYRDILGLYEVDTVGRRIKLRFADLTMPESEGTIPTPDGPVSLKWCVDGETLRYVLDAPEGYQVEVENLGGKKLVKE